MAGGSPPSENVLNIAARLGFTYDPSHSRESAKQLHWHFYKPVTPFWRSLQLKPPFNLDVTIDRSTDERQLLDRFNFVAAEVPKVPLSVQTSWILPIARHVKASVNRGGARYVAVIPDGYLFVGLYEDGDKIPKPTDERLKAVDVMARVCCSEMSSSGFDPSRVPHADLKAWATRAHGKAVEDRKYRLLKITVNGRALTVGDGSAAVKDRWTKKVVGWLPSEVRLVDGKGWLLDAKSLNTLKMLTGSGG